MKVTRQLVSLCLGIGMSLGGYSPAIAQDMAKADPSSHPNKTFHPPIKALTIGDQVPDIDFENVLNYKSKTAKLSDFKGKLVILDMWSTWCSSCIKTFPKMEELQKKFDGKIQILLVNPNDPKYETEEKIIQTLEKNKLRTGVSSMLPIPIHDEILNKYFPHQYIPHVIWINGNGNIIGITNSLDVSEKNIQIALSGKEGFLPIKNDWALDFNKPLFVDDNGSNSNNFVYRSLFTRYLGGIGFKMGTRRNNNEITGFYIVNATLRHLITLAYSNTFNGISKNRILLEVTKSSSLTTEYDTSNAYCYDLIIRPTSEQYFDPNKYLQEDLKRSFNLTVRKEKRTMKCLVFTLNKNSITALCNRGVSDSNKDITTKVGYQYSLAEIVKNVCTRFDMPLIDEIGINKQSIDIKFDNKLELLDTSAVLSVLKNAGFNIYEDNRVLDVAVITDK